MNESVHLFFDGWPSLLRTVVVGTLSYVVLLLMLRVSGARTLARMSTFDFVIAVAIGATYGRLITAREVTLVEAVVAFVVLVVLHLIFSSLMVYAPRLTRWLSPQPVLVCLRGEYFRDTMRRQRITEAELREAVREHGIGSMEEVGAIIVETNGRLSVIRDAQTGNGSALRDVGAIDPGVANI